MRLLLVLLACAAAAAEWLPDVRRGGPLNVTVSVNLDQPLLATENVLLELDHTSLSKAIIINACGKHRVQWNDVEFFYYGPACPAPPGRHLWTLVALVPPRAPLGEYMMRLSLPYFRSSVHVMRARVVV